jgi:D-lactate dehydrogenase
MNNAQLYKALRKFLPKDRILKRLIDRYAFASDAGFYYKVPRLIVRPEKIEEIISLFAVANTDKIPLVFRTGGTSLSGQSITDGILVDLSRDWRNACAEDEGKIVKVQPGITGNTVNNLLRKYGSKIGPDPASINAAMMGGILANNSSGMCCGVVHNSYHTLQSIHFVLANGHSFDTGKAGDHLRFEITEPEIFNGILTLRDLVISNDELCERIKLKYRIKNTVGYGLNAFLDFEHPLDILGFLLIGSEGTLAFIAEAKLKTIPEKAYKKTGLLLFKDPLAACEAIPLLKMTNPEALELMDRRAIRSVENLKEAPAYFKELPDSTTAILCEYQATSADILDTDFNLAIPVLEKLNLVRNYEFTSDKAEQEKLWKLRKGLYPSVAAVRAKGSTVLLEDIAVPIENLGQTVLEIQQLFERKNYPEAIIFGHAKEGNLHFVLSQSFNSEKEAKLLDEFTKELAAIVFNNKGSLKAEHGTGRQIAPFVKDEWGEDAYFIMRELKLLLDPNMILNPDVIISDNPQIHIQDLKTMPLVDDEVDSCMECGYCEDHCPSRDYTLTPRQRIVVRRAVKRLNESGNSGKVRHITRDYQHAGLSTCAVDGLCSVACPVGINTGKMVKQLRLEKHSFVAHATAFLVSKKFRVIENIVGGILNLGTSINIVFGKNFMNRLSVNIHKIIPSIPIWNLQLTNPPKYKYSYPPKPDILYFPACITRMMGNDIELKNSCCDIFLNLSSKAGISVLFPREIKGLCCGQAFSSKGFRKAYIITIERTISRLYQLTGKGSIPVVMDITSCTNTILDCREDLSEPVKKLFDELIFLDVIDYMHDWLLPRLKILKKKERIALHPVCALSKNENQYIKFKNIAANCAREYFIPPSAGCCGTAGDRGFYYPQLVKSATMREAQEVKGGEFEGYYSTAKTCEMSMSEATGKNYRSILYLLNDVTEQKS